MKLHQPKLWFITGGYLVKRWFIPAAARARGQSNDLNREILASNLFNCHKEVINALPVPSISRCIHIVYRHKNVWEYQWSNFIYNCMSTFLYYVRCKDALLDCSAPGGERCKSLTWVDEIIPDDSKELYILHNQYRGCWCPGGTRCQGISSHRRHRTWPKLVQVMAYRLKAPSHYLNQCWGSVAFNWEYQNSVL